MSQIRKMTEEDRALFLEMLGEFYSSSAVQHAIPREHYERTFEECVKGSPFAAAYILEEAGACAGYGLLAFSYSNEAGGLVLWLEELYVRPAFQGKGLGSAFFRFLEREYGGRTARWRLEVERGNAGAIALYERLGFETFPYVQMVRDFADESGRDGR